MQHKSGTALIWRYTVPTPKLYDEKWQKSSQENACYWQLQMYWTEWVWSFEASLVAFLG